MDGNTARKWEQSYASHIPEQEKQSASVAIQKNAGLQQEKKSFILLSVYY